MKLESDRYKTGEKAFTRGEYNKLLESITKIEDKLLIVLGVSLGLRRSDLCNIECDNIDLKNGRLTYWEEKKDRLKTVDIPQTCINLIQMFYNTISRDEIKKRKYLFSFRGRQAYNRFNKCLVIAGISERPIHALRATCIKFAHDAGWSDEQIAKLTGDRITTIQEHYRIPSVDEMRELTKDKPII